MTVHVKQCLDICHLSCSLQLILENCLSICQLSAEMSAMQEVEKKDAVL